MNFKLLLVFLFPFANGKYIYRNLIQTHLPSTEDITDAYGNFEVPLTNEDRILLKDFFVKRPKASIWQPYGKRKNCGTDCIQAHEHGNSFGDDFFYHNLLPAEVFHSFNKTLQDISLLVLIGGMKGDGAFPHRHTPSWNFLLSGEKQWTFEDGTVITQRVGDLIKVPDQLLHSTLNTEDGFAVLLQTPKIKN